MSRWVMKPLFSTSHIWKNSRVFSRIVWCPMSKLPHAATSSLPPWLCRAARATVPLMVLLLAQAAGKAAMAFVSPLLWDSHKPGSVGGVEGKEIPEKSNRGFRLLYIRGSHQCHTLSSLSNLRCSKSIRPGRRMGGESSVWTQTLVQWFPMSSYDCAWK